MIISFYSEEMRHITTALNIKAKLTKRAYADDSFTGEGYVQEDVQTATIAVYAEDNGKKRYASLVKSVVEENGVTKITGKDLRTLFDTEIRIKADSKSLKDILYSVANAVFIHNDKVSTKIPVNFDFEIATENVGEEFGLWSEKETVNAYAKILPYLKYYGYFLSSDFDEDLCKIIFKLKKGEIAREIKLEDFDYSAEIASGIVNKAVAIVENNGEEILRKYFYRTTKNEIMSSDIDGLVTDRIYPVKTVFKVSETAYQAQFDALKELADARFNDNILINNIPDKDPVDFKNIGLLTVIKCYKNKTFYKELPIAELEESSDSGEKTMMIKLGFKKTLLTQIIKGK